MLLTLSEIRAHCQIDGTDHDSVLTIYAEAAEASAMEYIGRNVYADSTALTTAQAGAYTILSAATTAHTAATVAAQALTDESESEAAQAAADRAYDLALDAYRRAMSGMVANFQFKAACLLTTAHLFKNREDTISGTIIASLPFGSRSLLQPLREYV